jgi:ADP-ribosyl-[dinitrogen reductase] hydrolase
MTLRGICLCQAVGYEADQLDMAIVHCHCATCRKAHASAYTSTAGVQKAHFKVTKGEGELASHESSPGKLRHFCANCGTHLWAERAGQAHVIFRVATLDDDPGQRPQVHIWTSHDVDWLDPSCPSYPEGPPGR